MADTTFITWQKGYMVEETKIESTEANTASRLKRLISILPIVCHS